MTSIYSVKALNHGEGCAYRAIALTSRLIWCHFAASRMS